MISLEYLIFYSAFLSILLLVFSSILCFYNELKEKIWEYNKREIENILDLYCKKSMVFGINQKVEIFSYKNFSYFNFCGYYHIKSGKHVYTIKYILNNI